MNKAKFTNSLLDWYDQSKRILPWRDNPNPYHVWISEIMLQQTRVETVIPYFNRFIQELPTIYDLSVVDDDRLNKLWEGLGYYSRVRNLKKAAITIMNEFGGQIPQNQKELESLSGIGPYTSGAVLSIAFNKKYTAVDGNVLRVFARILGIRENIKEPLIKKEIKDNVEKLLPMKRVGDFNQGLMEIGATVCLPNGAPTCSVCPFNNICVAYNKGLINEIPAKQQKKKKREEDITVFVIRYNDEFAIEQRPSSGLLAGLFQFPYIEGHKNHREVSALFPGAKVQRIQDGKHIFSHIVWHQIGYEIKVDNKFDKYIWTSKSDIESTYSIPTAFKVYKKYILK